MSPTVPVPLRKLYVPFNIGIGKENNQYFINSGSITLPKNNTPHSYLVIENNEESIIVTLKDIDGNVVDSVNIK